MSNELASSPANRSRSNLDARSGGRLRKNFTKREASGHRAAWRSRRRGRGRGETKEGDILPVERRGAGETRKTTDHDLRQVEDCG